MRGVTAVLAGMLAAGCIADVEPAGAERGAIVDGTPDAEHDAVVAIGGQRVACDAPFVPTCTGVLIAPRVVLTAAHCVADGRAGRRLEIMEGDSPDDPVVRYSRVRRIRIHRGFDPDSNTADLALLELDETSTVPPTTLRSEPLDDALTGSVVTMVGYGVVDTSTEPDGVRRSGTATVTEVSGGGFRMEPSPAMSCRADSGGPVLDDAGEVLGITSFGDPGCREFGIATRVDPHLEGFVEPFLAEIADAPPPPASTIGYGDACETPCATDDDCPAGLACLPGVPTPRCEVPGTPRSTLGSACDPSSRCDCVRVLANGGPEDCRCVAPCDDAPPPPDDPGGCCSVAGRAPPTELPGALLLLGAFCSVLRRVYKF